MDITHRLLPDTQSDEAIESLPLLNTESGRRPYQAYCVTEPSSRVSSPDILIPRPLRIRVLPDQHRDATQSESRQIPSDPLLQFSTAATENNDSLAIIPRRNYGSNAQQESSNQTWSQDTILERQHHTTQAVTPRGSHPLMASQAAMCDRPLSHSRMQQTTPAYVATSLSYQRKPLPQHANTVGMDSRPLPPLPDETLDASALGTSQLAHNSLLNGDAEQALRLPRTLVKTSEDDHIEGRPPIVNHSRKVLQISPKVPQEVERYIVVDDDDEEPSRPRVGYQPNLHLPSFHALRSDILPQRDDPSPSQNRYLDEPARPPSSASSYVPRGLFLDIDHDARAFRRTEPKDAKLKYQFGRRPSLRLSAPPPPPLHTSTSQSTLPRLPSPSEPHRLFHPISPPYTEGPRPPPWGSIDALQVQRQTRSEARERLDARKYRMSLGSKGSSSTETLRGEEMRREVEEYRAQVLRVYPDMEFDGEAGKGGRECFCVVM